MYINIYVYYNICFFIHTVEQWCYHVAISFLLFAYTQKMGNLIKERSTHLLVIELQNFYVTDDI